MNDYYLDIFQLLTKHVRGRIKSFSMSAWMYYTSVQKTLLCHHGPQNEPCETDLKLILKERALQGSIQFDTFSCILL